MSEPIERRLEEVMSLLPCPFSGCWSVRGSRQLTTTIPTANATSWKSGPRDLRSPPRRRRTITTRTDRIFAFEFAEFDFTELVKQVRMEHFHYSQVRAIFEIGWKEFGQDLELRVHLRPEEADEGW